MRPLLKPELVRRRFDLYLNEDEHQAIENKAKTAHISMSSYLRKVAMGHSVNPPPKFAVQQWEILGRTTKDLNGLLKANQGRLTESGVSIIKRLAEEIALVRLSLVSNGERNDR